MGIMANSDDPDEMPLYAAFHQDLHYLLRQKFSSEKDLFYINYSLKPLNIYNGPS